MLIVRLKTPQMPQNCSAQFVCPSPKVWDFNEKRLHWELSSMQICSHILAKLMKKEPLWQKTTCSILEKRENRNLISCTHKISNYGNQIKLSAWTKYIVNTRQYYLVSFWLWNCKVGSSKLLRCLPENHQTVKLCV